MARYDPLDESHTHKDGEDVWELMACFPGWVKLVAGGLLRGCPHPLHQTCDLSQLLSSSTFHTG